MIDDGCIFRLYVSRHIDKRSHLTSASSFGVPFQSKNLQTDTELCAMDILSPRCSDIFTHKDYEGDLAYLSQEHIEYAMFSKSFLCTSPPGPVSLLRLFDRSLSLSARRLYGIF